MDSGQAVINELNDKIRTEGWVVTTSKAQTGHGTYKLYEDLQQTNDPRKTASNFMDEYSKNLDEDLEQLADDLESGTKFSSRDDTRQVDEVKNNGAVAKLLFCNSPFWWSLWWSQKKF